MHWLVLLEETTVPGFTGSFIFGQDQWQRPKEILKTVPSTLSTFTDSAKWLYIVKHWRCKPKKNRHTGCTMQSTRGFYFQGPRWRASLTRLHSVTPENKQTIMYDIKWCEVFSKNFYGQYVRSIWLMCTASDLGEMLQSSLNKSAQVVSAAFSMVVGRSLR